MTGKAAFWTIVSTVVSGLLLYWIQTPSPSSPDPSTRGVANAPVHLTPPESLFTYPEIDDRTASFPAPNTAIPALYSPNPAPVYSITRPDLEAVYGQIYGGQIPDWSGLGFEDQGLTGYWWNPTYGSYVLVARSGVGVGLVETDGLGSVVGYCSGQMVDAVTAFLGCYETMFGTSMQIYLTIGYDGSLTMTVLDPGTGGALMTSAYIRVY